MSRVQEKKYFKTFSALTYPVTPHREVDLADAMKLRTYYEATYDSSRRIIEFVKHLRELDVRENMTWKVMFTERYEYWPSGRLKSRVLVSDDGTASEWKYPDQRSRWSDYMDGILGSWFCKPRRGRPSETPAMDELELADRVFVCHELVTEIEAAVFETISRRPRRGDWAVSNITTHLADFKELAEYILPGSRPRISFLVAADSGQGDFLEHFDDLIPIAPLWDFLDRHVDAQLTSPQFPALDVETDEGWQSWLQLNEVASLLVVPVRAIDRGELQVAGYLVFSLKIKPEPRPAAAIAAIYRRLGHLCEFAIEAARGNDLIEDNADSSEA